MPTEPPPQPPRPTPPPRGFAIKELEGRLERAQRLMAGERLDALLLTTPAEVRYFSGFLTEFWQSPTRPWFLLVPAYGAPVVVIPEIGVPLMARTWIRDIRSWPAPRPADEGVGLLADLLAETGGRRIGVPMGHGTTLRMPLADFGRLKDALPAAACVDATPVVRALRMVKSEAEIAKIAFACRAASDAFAGIGRIALPGRPLAEVFRRFRMALIGAGADDVPYLAGAAAPGGYADVISPPDERPLAQGDVLMLDTGATHDGYFCDFDRNFSLGPPDAATARAHATLWRATEAGLAAARPGATAAEVFRAMRRVIADAGHDCGNVGRLGHGLGMQLTEWPSLMGGDDTVLAPGMVLTLEPGLEIAPGRGLVHEEDIVIRDGPPELLTVRTPPELPVLAPGSV